MPIELPALPYPRTALEPHISAATLDQHHGSHHRAHVEETNRLLDGSNSRVYRLSLSNGATFWQIGSDTGLLPAPLPLTSLLLSPGERADVVLDFEAYPAGTEIVLRNDAPAPYPGQPGVGVVADVMKFVVQSALGDTDALPQTLVPVPRIPVATAEVQRIARQVLPATITGGFSGTAQAFEDSQRGMGILLLITIFIIYIILGILYESFIHPVTILTGLPFAAFGALLALYVTGVELGVYGYVGIIMLIGIVEKNAIMMIDFALERQRSENISPSRAIVEAASVWFRPIMMTTVSAIAGTLPIAIGVGTSAASRPAPTSTRGSAAWPQARRSSSRRTTRRACCSRRCTTPGPVTSGCTCSSHRPPDRGSRA